MGALLFVRQGWKFENQVTSGAWVAGPLLQVDAVRRQIYFYAYGRKEVDPYYYILYQADLDKENALTCLTRKMRLII
ncbi:MAG: DPP IV N-terminal domain-containing protein [Butyricimonas paravirosa]